MSRAEIPDVRINRGLEVGPFSTSLAGRIFGMLFAVFSVSVGVFGESGPVASTSNAACERISQAMPIDEPLHGKPRDTTPGKYRLGAGIEWLSTPPGDVILRGAAGSSLISERRWASAAPAAGC